MLVTDKDDWLFNADNYLKCFSINTLPDSHLFRVEKGKIRFVHTLTVCTIPGCGFNVRPQPCK